MDAIVNLIVGTSTTLDVYVMAVSYTHLDVYKRQHLKSRVNRRENDWINT